MWRGRKSNLFETTSLTFTERSGGSGGRNADRRNRPESWPEIRRLVGLKLDGHESFRGHERSIRRPPVVYFLYRVIQRTLTVRSTPR